MRMELTGTDVFPSARSSARRLIRNIRRHERSLDMVFLLYLLVYYESLVIGPVTRAAWLIVFTVDCIFLVGGTWRTFRRWDTMTKKDRLQALFWVVL